MDNSVQLIQLSNYVRPEVKEEIGRKWVLNGEKNSFFQYIIDRKNGSPTNESVLNVYSQLLYGKGIRINGQEEVYEELVEIFPKREQRKCLDDYKCFGMYAMQILRAKGGGIAQILHLPVNKIGFEKMDENGDINNIYYCEDWGNTVKYKPELYPIFKGKMTYSVMVKVVAPYSAGKYYFSDPDYLAALQYAQIEEEISNFSINHILNGLSFGYIININNGGSLTTEEKDQLERVIKQKLTGSKNAGKFILSFNDGKDAEVTIYPLEVNDAHNQWESLREEARQQILTCHGVTSPLLFGLPSAGGFGSNADELDTASKLLQDYQITPKQERFIDELANILELAGLETDLEFIPLRDTYKSTEEQPQEDVEDNTVDEEENTEEVQMAGFNPNQPRDKSGMWTDGIVGNNNNEILEWENSVRYNDYESVIVYDENGNILFIKTGQSRMVNFSDEELNILKGKALTHNHPFDYSFSKEDLDFAFYHQLKEMRVVTKNRTFTILFNGEKLSNKELGKIKSTYTRVKNQVIKNLSEKYRSGKITKNQYNTMYHHEIINLLSLTSVGDKFKYIVHE